MIRLRTLGTTGLTDESGADLAPVLRQPKRFALLAYLALARPRGFQRRDSILALFWPELDDAHARASLRQSLYTLRRELPDGVLVNRGDGEVGLAAGVWCDAHAFEEAVERGAVEEAMQLYRGDLLPGYHVADAAPEFEYWLEAERSRLRERALEAAGEACALAEARGELDAAVQWAGRVVTLAPLDEEPVRRHMELQHRRGDQSGALLAFEGWKRRLEEQLGLGPSPGLIELAARLRTASPPKRTPEQRASTFAAGADSAAGPASDGGGSDETHRRRLQVVAAVAFVGLLAVLATLLPLRFDWRDGTASPAVQRAVVAPFSYRGGAEAEYLSEGLVYLFTVALDGEDLRVADAHSVLRRSNETGREEYDATAAAELAQGFEAGYFLLGSAVETAGRLRLTGGLYRRASAEPVAMATATGEVADVLDLVDQVAAELLTALSGRAGSRVTRIASVTTQSLPALKAYLRGERLLAEGHADEAIEAFEAAGQADTLFALAHYRTSVAASSAFRGDLATRASARAVRHADRLPERERRLLEAHEAYREGEASEAAELFRELAALYPEDPEIWYRLGEVVLHLGPVRGRSLTEARDPFLRAIALDTTRVEAYYHLSQIAASEGDTARALEYADRALAVAPTGARAPQLRLMRSVLSGGAGWAGQIRRVADADDFTLVSSAYSVGVYLGRPDLARDVARLLVAEGRAGETRVFGHLLLAELELALGRPTAAAVHVEAIERLDPRAAAEYGALLALAPAARPDTAGMLRLMRRLPRPDGNPASGSAVDPRARWKPDERYAPLPTLYARGRMAGALGRASEVEDVVGALAGVVDSVSAADLANDFRVTPAGAMALPTRPAPGPPTFAAPPEIMILSPMLSRPARRFAEARRLEQLGEVREALRWYESLTTYSVHDLPWGIPALLDRARLHRELGEDEAAVALYRRFEALWEDAEDPILRDSARALAARIARERP